MKSLEFRRKGICLGKIKKTSVEVAQLKVTLCKLHCLSQWVWPVMCEFAEQKLILLFVSLSERIFSQVKAVQDEERIGNTNKHWTAENGIKIRFYSCV